MEKDKQYKHNADVAFEKKSTNSNKSMSHGQVVSPSNRSKKLSKEAYLKVWSGTYYWQ